MIWQILTCDQLKLYSWSIDAGYVLSGIFSHSLTLPPSLFASLFLPFSLVPPLSVRTSVYFMSHKEDMLKWP